MFGVGNVFIVLLEIDEPPLKVSNEPFLTKGPPQGSGLCDRFKCQSEATGGYRPRDAPVIRSVGHRHSM